MDRRLRRLAALGACVCTLTFTSVAYAYLTSDLNNWNLSESLSTYGPPTQYHISTGTDGLVSYRWLDTPSKVTVVSANACADWALLGSASTYPVNDTSYRHLWDGNQGDCFVLRGRTAAGQGSMLNHEGRVRR